jgi:hypothetical protein
MQADVSTRSRVVGFCEAVFAHSAAIFVGFVLMVLGLGMGVTMVLLPVGLVVGLIGVLIFVGGLLVKIKP